MAPNEIRVEDILEKSRLSENNSPAGLRAARDFIPKALRSLFGLLEQLRASESVLLIKIYRNLDAEGLEKKKSDFFMKVDPIQSYLTGFFGFPSTDSRISYTNTKILENTIGLSDIMKEYERVAEQVKSVQRQIRHLQEKQKSVNNQLGTTAGISEITLDVDRQATRLLGEVYALSEIYSRYKKLSTKENGDEAFTQDQKISNQIENLKRQWVAFSERNPLVKDGTLPLNLDDVGNPENGKILSEYLNILKLTTNNTDIASGVKKYIDQSMSNVNNITISKNVIKRTDSANAPIEGDDLKSKTNTFDKFQNYTKESGWWSALSLAKPLEALEKAFKQRVLKTRNAVGYCDTEPTEEEKARSKVEAQQKKIAVEASNEVERRLLRSESESRTIWQSMWISIKKEFPDLAEAYVKINTSSVLAGRAEYNGGAYIIGISNPGPDLSAAKIQAEARCRAFDPFSARGKTGAELSTDFKYKNNQYYVALYKIDITND